MASNSTLASNGPSETSTYKPRYIDIGINLADPIFRGHYHGKSRHPDDLAGVVQRAIDVGCAKLIVTGSSFKSSRDALKIAQQFPHHVYTTAGIHPCSSSIFSTSHHMHHDESGSESESSPATAAATAPETAADSASTPIPICADPDPDAPQPEDPSLIDHVRTPQLIASLSDLIDSNRSPKGGLIAFGEFGLDYDRLHYCSRTIQLHSFRVQLSLAASLTPQLPLFLHSRAAHRDFVDCLKEAFGPNLEKLEKGGVVHSFTGTLEEMQELMDLGLFIGVNGCSFKTEENCAVVKQIRLDRIMLETDGPWCEVRGGHEGWKYLVKYYAREREAKEKAEAEAKEKADEEARKKKAAEEEEKQKAEEAAKALADVSLNENGTQPQTEGEVGNGTPDVSGTSTPNPSGQQQPGQKRERRKKQPQPPPQPKKNKNAKKESEVPERFKVVKKEKWEEGAMVKGRNEPCTIERIAIIVAEIKGISVEEVCEAAWRNTVKVFGLEE
ncbi:uncharacterized protein B0T23DRAFT_429335 [Neurospora hispaniola]|uniref:Uncharacterized protein n=1 Tax=Neurospora hispaniola TaxID=588809 RepID=A0AAJ0I540_9PEZI|nr:hypothetical protein B0T23DRAFT_429335 [Neurospora hispaniola]